MDGIAYLGFEEEIGTDDGNEMDESTVLWILEEDYDAPSRSSNDISSHNAKTTTTSSQDHEFLTTENNARLSDKLFPYRISDRNSTSTRYEIILSAPSDNQLTIMWSIWLVTAIVTAIVIFIVLYSLMKLIFSQRKLRFHQHHRRLI